MILKMLNGSPFKAVTFLDFSTPAKSGSSSPKKTTTEEKDEADVIELLKTFLKDLIDNALPGDFAYASNQLVRLFTRIENKLENPFLGTGSIASEYIQCILLVSKLRLNKEDYKKALDTATSKDTLEEYAINSRGHVLVKTNEGITWKNPEQITASDLLITNQDLLLLRREGAEGMSNSNNYSDIIMGSVGYNQIVETVNKTLLNLGSNKYTDGITAYLKAKEENPDTSIEEMVNEGIISEDLANLTLQVLSYMWDNLPANMKSILKINSGEYTEDGGFKELTKIVGSKTSQTITAKTIKGKSNSSNSSKDDENSYKSSFVLAVQSGKGAHPHKFRLNDKSNVEMSVTGDLYESVLTTDGKYIGKVNMELLLGLSGLRSIIGGDIYFGNLKLSLESLDKIMYDSTGLLRVLLPIDLLTGAPDFALLDEYEKAVNDFLLTGGTNNDRKKIFGNNPKLLKLINSNGELNMSMFKPFMLLNGVTVNDYFSELNKNEFVVKKEYNDATINELKSALSKKVGNDYIFPDLDEKGFFEPDWASWINPHSNIYRGTIFIPIDINKTAALLGSSLEVPIETFNKQEENYQLRYIQGNASSNVFK